MAQDPGYVTVAEASARGAPVPDTPAEEPLRSSHTSNFAEILDELGISLVVSTYQAGKLVLLRSEAGKINTHFRGFPHPMGIAAEGDRLAVGGGMRIWEFHNLTAVAAKLEPVGKFDACFLPRSAHITGDVQIHDLQYGTDGLWLVNTRFSCLATLDAVHSFVPRWRPPFISALAPEDRCHLNGLCVVEGQPAFVTALGETDEPVGWRQDKKQGGALLEVSTGKTLVRGLSMPHSPRWFDGRLWLLESGTGGFGYVDARTREYVPVTKLPGFTRGLDFRGPLAFIGLSQVRERAIFSGVPITEEKIERRSGVWVVNIHTGKTIAWLQFQDAVQEIFAVQVLPGIRYPELVGEFHVLNADSFELPGFALDRVPATLVTRVEQPASSPALISPSIDGGTKPPIGAGILPRYQRDGLGRPSSLELLARHYPWPAECPSVAPNQTHGWLSAATRELLAAVLDAHTRLVVEIGSWLGLSTRYICEHAPNAVVVAVDHWQGSSEHRDDAELSLLLPLLYETFLSSCWQYRARIIPCRLDSQRALEELAARGLSPDVVYLDASHEYEAVKADTAAIRRFFPDALLVGDDWDWPSVRLAATHVAEAHGASIRAYGSAWQFCPRSLPKAASGDSASREDVSRPSAERSAKQDGAFRERTGAGKPTSALLS